MLIKDVYRKNVIVTLKNDEKLKGFVIDFENPLESDSGNYCMDLETDLGFYSIDESENDLAVFTINNSIKTMTIVTNKGRIKFISKTEHFKEKVMKKMIANLLIEKSLDVISTKDIERLLKELYNNDNII